MKFDAGFFEEHQNTLLRLLNSPIGGMVRRGLWIPDNRLIVKITPESYHIALPNRQIKATFHSNKQHAQALHRNYKVIWEAFHAWDMRIANRFLPAWNVGFDTYSSQPDETAGLDTFLDSAAASTNYATNTVLWCGESNAGAQTWFPLINFDFSSMGVAPNVTAASLELVISTDLATIGRNFILHRVRRNWVENQATWNQWSTGNNWTTGGCQSTTDDYDSTSLSTLNFPTGGETGTKTWAFSAGGLTMFNGMLNGTYGSYGFVMRNDGLSNDAYAFHSASAATGSNRPKFDATYTASNQGFFF